MRRRHWLGLGLAVAGPLAAHAGSATIDVRSPSGQAITDAVVFLESREARAAVRPASNIEISQQGRQFVPSVTVVPVGTAVAFPNRDSVRHHVYSFSQAKTFELKLYIGTPANPVVFDRAGIVVLGCNIHDNMAAWVVVVDTPYHTRSGTDGKALLEGVPPGTYRLRVWHAGLPVGAPALDQSLTVPATGAVATRVQLPLPS